MDDVAALRAAARDLRHPGGPGWHAAVGLWLDYCAIDLAEAGGDPNGCPTPEEIRSAVRIARAYLAEATP